MQRKPRISVTCCHKLVENHPSQATHEKYLQAVYYFGGLPVMIPSILQPEDVVEALAGVEGIMLTGSPSNIAPQRYQANHDEPKQDLGRDAVSFTMIDYALTRDIPILGICRGFQELNVSQGGTLHPKLYEVDGMIEHREGEGDLATQYADSHLINIREDGFLAEFAQAQGQSAYSVNSLHGQGVKTLASNAIVAATAEDGLIEAFSLSNARFAAAVQWHPEWHCEDNPLSQYLYGQFIGHCRQTRR